MVNGHSTQCDAEQAIEEDLVARVIDFDDDRCRFERGSQLLSFGAEQPQLLHAHEILLEWQKLMLLNDMGVGGEALWKSLVSVDERVVKRRECRGEARIKEKSRRKQRLSGNKGN